MSEEENNTTTEEEVVEAVEAVEDVLEEEVSDTEQPTSESQMQQLHPREVLLQVFEQGARASEDWEQSQAKIQCILALQQAENLADIPRELKAEISLVLNKLLQAGQLQFGLQQILYPMVKDLE